MNVLDSTIGMITKFKQRNAYSIPILQQLLQSHTKVRGDRITLQVIVMYNHIRCYLYHHQVDIE